MGTIQGQYKSKSTPVPQDNDNSDNIQGRYIAKKKKPIGLIVVIVLLSLTCVGLIILLCTGVTDGRVADLEGQVAARDMQLQEKAKRIEELKQAVEDTEVSEVIPTTSLQMVEGKDVPEFFLIDGQFVAPTQLSIPETYDDVNNSYVQVGSMFKFTPSNKWIVKVNGAVLEVSHPAKIWGKLKALQNNDVVLEENMHNLIQECFKKYPKTTITYRKLFMNDKVSGLMGTATLKVQKSEDSDEKTPMIINTGFVQFADYTLSFMFLADESDVAQELIDLFIKSGTVGDTKVLLE